MNKISIVIPTYEMGGRGHEFLERSFKSLLTQTFTDFEIVVTDNSENDDIFNLCQSYTDLNIKYFKNPIKGMAQNTNEGIRRSTGEIIKILFMDDLFRSKDSLKTITDNFKESSWMVTGCVHLSGDEYFNPHYPVYNHDIYAGHNTIGSPSVLAFKNDDPLLFDETMTWMLDCDYYARLYKRYGEPKYLYDLNVVIGIGSHQTTNALSEEIKRKEREYMLNKNLK